jgi:hypothetical protein
MNFEHALHLKMLGIADGFQFVYHDTLSFSFVAGFKLIKLLDWWLGDAQVAGRTNWGSLNRPMNFISWENWNF